MSPQTRRNKTSTVTTRCTHCAAVMPRLLTLKQTAALLNISYWTVRSLIDGGHLPVLKHPLAKNARGAKLFIDVLDIEKYIQTNKDTIIY